MALETLITEVFLKAVQGLVQVMLSISLQNLNISSQQERILDSDIYLSTLAHSILKVFAQDKIPAPILLTT